MPIRNDRIPEEYKSGNGPDGFGKRLDRMMIANPVDLVKKNVHGLSRLSPVFVLGVDPSNPTGDVTLQPLSSACRRRSIITGRK